ncbi:hypothetical protein D3C81_1083440 [compost metagenome]
MNLNKETVIKQLEQVGLGAYGKAIANVESNGWACLKAIDGFPDAVQEAVRLNEPSVVARHLLDTTRPLIAADRSANFEYLAMLRV